MGNRGEGRLLSSLVHIKISSVRQTQHYTEAHTALTKVFMTQHFTFLSNFNPKGVMVEWIGLHYILHKTD